MQNYQFERDEGYDILDPFGAGVGYENPYPTEPPSPNDPNADCDYTDHGHGEQESYNCTLPDDFDDQSDEDSQVGSIAENKCYNEFGTKVDCNDERYEVDHGAFKLNKGKDGHLFFTLNTKNEPNALTSGGRFVPRYSSTGVDGEEGKREFYGYDFVADDVNAVDDDQSQTTRLPTHAQLRDGLISARDRNGGKCGEFLDKVRNQLGIKKTFEELFDDLVKKFNDSNGKKGGVAYVRELITPGVGMFGKDSKDSEDDGKYPYSYGNEIENALAIKIKPEFGNAVQLGAYVNTLIHELIHYAGVNSHKEFAAAGFKSLDVSGKAAHSLPKKGGENASSKYFTQLLQDY